MKAPARRAAQIERATKETQIKVRLNLDGRGRFAGSAAIPFFEHMLDHLARHSRIDLRVEAKGDVEVDSHHTVEDVGISIGQALAKAIGAKKGIARYGDARVPMEEALAEAVLDFCGRAYLHFDAPLRRERLGGFDVEVTEDFFRALCSNAGLTAHLRVLHGRNEHHIVEALFKAFARALGQAVRLDPARSGEAPSTKGVL